MATKLRMNGLQNPGIHYSQGNEVWGFWVCFFFATSLLQYLLYDAIHQPWLRYPHFQYSLTAFHKSMGNQKVLI